jgi:hypothetical protein
VGQSPVSAFLYGLLCHKKKLVEAVTEWIEADRDRPSAWDFGNDVVRTGGVMPELEQWYSWRRGQTAVLPTNWRRQPLKQLVINRTLDFVEHTWRLKNTKDLDWGATFDGTQFGLIGWIDGS